MDFEAPSYLYAGHVSMFFTFLSDFFVELRLANHEWTRMDTNPAWCMRHKLTLSPYKFIRVDSC
jgi:hypothetical protein